MKRKRAKTAGAPKSKKKQEILDSGDTAEASLAAPAKKRKPEKEETTSEEKESKQTEIKVTPKGKAKQEASRGPQSAKVPSKGKAAIGVRTAVRKSTRLSLR